MTSLREFFHKVISLPAGAVNCPLPVYQSGLGPQPKKKRIEPQRHEGTELDILQNRVTVLEKAAFSFAACLVKQLQRSCRKSFTRIARQMKNTLPGVSSLMIFESLSLNFLVIMRNICG
jgi:hypothetical protein